MQGCDEFVMSDRPILRSFVIPVLDFSPHSPFNIRTLLDDLAGIPGEVICVFNSREVFDELRFHGRVDKFCYNGLNAGVSRSWNMGINLAEGRAIFILNADLHLRPPAVEDLERYLFRLERAAIVGPHGANVDYSNLRDAQSFVRGSFQQPVQCNAVSGFLFVIHHERYLQHRLQFDARFSPCFFEEWDMGLQVMEAGLACYAVPVVDFEHHWGISTAAGSSRINYFGRELQRDQILMENREKFKAKWFPRIFEREASVQVPGGLDQRAPARSTRVAGDAVSISGLQRLGRFIAEIQTQAYPESPMAQHLDITQKMLSELLAAYPLPENARILDVGCGQGPALDLFQRQRYRAIGITISDEDVRICREKGHEVYKMDQSFLDFPDQHFDLLWARHCIEHSIFPFFTLSEFFRTLKPGGYLYVEVPAPGTACQHETNRNHYSVLSESMWVSLITRSGFRLLQKGKINFDAVAGPDEYWVFVCQKSSSRGPNA
jgi:2-polyprenyl-3-methyl-5-hydroxy-6-metoxy-1,4-benzoquinol methylase